MATTLALLTDRVDALVAPGRTRMKPAPMFIRMPKISWLARGIARRAFYYVDNSGNCNPARDGEYYFIGAMLDYYASAGPSAPDHPLQLVDAGANAGDYTQMLLHKGAQRGLPLHVHVFEPVRASFNRLSHRFADMPSVTLNHQALSRDCEPRPIFYDHEGSRLASLYQRDLRAHHMQLDQAEIISTRRLDDYIQQKALPHIHFLKIDVEGHEVAVLEGMGLYLDSDFVDFIQFEYGMPALDSGVTLMKLYDLLQTAGFVMTKVMRRGLEFRPYRPSMDNFADANYVAVSRRTQSTTIGVNPWPQRP